jgi:LacI family transcriptional regulator
MATKVATMKDVAEETGYSISTVSHVINKTRRVDDETRQAILDSIHRLNYKPNKLARGLKGKGSKTLGIIIADIREDFFSELVKSVESSACEKGFNMILCDSEDSLEKEESYVDMLIGQGVDGIMISPVNMDKPPKAFKTTTLPIVQIDRKFVGRKGDFVGIDNASSAHTSVNYLYDKGCRNIAFIGYNDKVYTIEERLAGYQRAMLEKNLDCKSNILRVMYHSDNSEFQIRTYLQAHPDTDGILCCTSNLCFETINAIEKMGLRIPQDIRVFSYDDSKWFDYLKYPISVIRQPTGEFGGVAIELMVDKIENRLPDVSKQILLDYELIDRG